LWDEELINILFTLDITLLIIYIIYKFLPEAHKSLMKLKKQISPDIDYVSVFGVHDSNLKFIEKLLEVKIYPGDSEIGFEGKEENINKAFQLVQSLINLSRNKSHISHKEIRLLFEQYERDGSYTLDEILTEGLITSKRGKKLKPKNLHQLEYIKKILNSDLVFAIGPAGTGKTYLAVGTSLHLLHKGEVDRIILTRPVVEAGENLGFLPGTLEEKIDPYLRPLFDAIKEMLGPEELKYYLETQTIEVAPLAYMRGRTLSNSFIILDEAQNTTTMQMKMFLTRLGENAKMVVTGDITQIDLPHGKESGLKQAIELFKEVSGIEIFEFTQEDVIRHGLVKTILEIYREKENST
jgi:phosphate starvation-inducible PhoH-like protein